MAAKKNNKIATARKQFVQQRVQATGKTGKEARQQFRQRFDKLAQTKQGRTRIAEVTQVKGIRKELAKSTRKTTTTKTGTTSTTTKTATTTNKTGTTTNKTGTSRPTGRITDSVDRIGYRSPTGLGKNQRRVVITPQELAQVQRELYPTPTTPPTTMPRSGAVGQYDVVLPPGKKDRGKGLDSWKRFLGL